MKFGGTSVADAERLQRAARRIVAQRERGQRVVAVLSARGQTTDELIAMAQEVSHTFGLWCHTFDACDNYPHPKGHIDPGESPEQAAAREVREETGIEGTLVEKIDDIRYWYSRAGTRVLKVVSFFLFRYRSGSVENHDHEVDSAEWIPLAEAPKLLAYRGERQVAAAAQSRWGRGR